MRFFFFLIIIVVGGTFGIIVFFPSLIISIYTSTISSQSKLIELAEVSSGRTIMSSKNLPDRMLVFNTLQFTVPWSKYSVKEQSLDSILVRSDSSMLFVTESQKEQDKVITLFAASDADADTISKAFEKETTKDDYTLYKTILHQNLSHVTLTKTTDFLDNNLVVLNLRELIGTLLGGNTTSGSFTTDRIRGVQIGNPKVINKVLLILFTDASDRYSVWLSGNITQNEVDTLIGSAGKI